MDSRRTRTDSEEHKERSEEDPVVFEMKLISWRPTKKAKRILDKVIEYYGYNRNQAINEIIERSGRIEEWRIHAIGRHRAALAALTNDIVLHPPSSEESVPSVKKGNRDAAKNGNNHKYDDLEYLSSTKR